MMNGGPFMLYALAQLHREEIERKARTAWQRATPPQPAAPRRSRKPAIALDAVAGRC